MELPPVTKSLRFRLSWITSAVVFGIGGVALGVIYLAILDTLRNDFVTQRLLTGGRVYEVDGVQLLVPEFEEATMRTVNSLFGEILLNRLAWVILVVLIVLFLLSLFVGWFAAGSALAPVGRITNVAKEIEATDLTRRIGLDGPPDELTTMAGTFDAMLDRLDRAFRAQRELLAQTSHDLRTPLAVIRSNVEVALDDPGTTIEDWRETGELVSRAADRMGSMIEELLAVARLEVGEVVMVSLDLADVARDTAGAWAARIDAAGVELSLTDDTAVVEGDRATIDRALDNLVENALRMSPAGSQLDVGTGTVDGWAWLAVADRGPGIDPAVVDGSAEGRGLGLAIVREVARLHHGQVTAASRAEGGAVVALWLPIDAPAAQEPPSDRLAAVYGV